MSANSPSMSIAEDEWLRRFRQRLIDRFAFTQQQADAHTTAVVYEDFEAFWDDPEGGADEEMSYAG
jgi:hypothetical protein